MSAFIVSILFISMCLVIKADLDRWLPIQRDELTTVISVNNRALYKVDSDNKLKVIETDIGFKEVGSDIQDVSVNDDLGIWATSTDGKILFRTGTTATNLIGIAWKQNAGTGKSIATGRYGLVFDIDLQDLVHSLQGITATNPSPDTWSRQYGHLVMKISCSLRVCFVTNIYNQLFTTGLLPNINSPVMSSDYSWIDSDVMDIAAYGDKTLWKIDTNGTTWEAVNVFDSGFVKVNWERRGYQATKFKDIAVTDKKAFAISNDGGIHVRTGCPIFDFEDDDISTWQQTGTAFVHQPVVGEFTNRGKVGHKMIDTYSKKKDYSTTGSTSQGDSPAGTLTSPSFQIRTDYLHFLIGGGSPPRNYVALVVNGNEEKTSSGRSKFKAGVAMGRFWWDVGSFVNKCARIKVID